MGLFYNYNKPGPGISKDAPKKKGILLYFELFFRHFWDFMKENMMFSIVSIPSFLIFMFLMLALNIFELPVTSNIDPEMATASLSLYYMFALAAMILLGTGPASAAMAYMMRCVTRETHCFLWSDFWDILKENFKNSIILYVMDIVILIVLLPVAYRFYYMQYADSGNIMFMILLIVLIIVTVLYIGLHQFFYQFIITYKLKFFDAVRNSLLLSMAYLPVTLLYMAFVFVVCYYLVVFINIIWVIFSVFLFLPAFLRYPCEFFAARTIEKKLLNNDKKEQEIKLPVED